jgi:hypothetical protein
MGRSAPSAQTVTQRTELPAWLEGVTQENLARADAISNRPFQPYQGQLTAGFAPEQEAAFQFAQAGIGATQPMFNQAFQTASDVAQYNPNFVAPSQVGVMNVGAGQTGFERVAGPSVRALGVGAERIGGAGVEAQNITAPNFLQGNVGAYMNPFIDNVENAALSRLQGATQTAVNRIGDQAVQARAFGGSRQGIAEGVALGEAARSAGELSANLRSQGFNQASALLQADQQRAMQAALANQQANLAAGTTSAQLAQQAALANQQTGLQAGLANQRAFLDAGTTSAQLAQQANLANQQAGMQTGQFNVDRGLQASLANQRANLEASQINAQQMLQAQQLNQQAGLQGAQQRLAAANQLAGLSTDFQRSRQLDAALLENIGAQRQAMQQSALDEAYARFQEQQNYPIEMLNLRLGATSATPYGTTQSGTQFVPRGNSFLQGLGTVGSAASGIAALAPLLGFSDKRMKTDIEKVGRDKETGLDMYAYRYKGDPKTYPKVVGPMAQDIEKKYPEQVREVAGRKAVNLGFGPMRKAMSNG